MEKTKKAGSPPASTALDHNDNGANVQQNLIPVNGKTKTLVEEEETDHKAWEQYIRVKTDYFKKSYSLTSKGEKVPELMAWKKGTITEDHGKSIYFHMRQNGQFYENFANVPDNDPRTYQRKIQGCYNLYEPIGWQPQEGNCQLTIDFLHHIFGDYYNVGIDWLTLLYTRPTQNLPAIGLVSKENATGKTTLLKLLKLIFGANAIILGNEDLSSNFNSPWATKLLIGVDETVIDKTIIKEKIKRLVTDNSILMERKGIDKVTLPWVGKFIMLSNNEANFIKVDDEDTRFFVCRVPPIKKRDPKLLEKMRDEIPAFLHLLLHRTLNFPESDRLWFDPKDFETPALRKMIENSRSRTEKELIDWCEQIFNADETLTEIVVTRKFLNTELSKTLRYNNLQNDLEKVLKENWKLSPEKNKKHDSPSLTEHTGVDVDGKQYREVILIWTYQITGRPYRIPKELVFQKLT